MRSTLSRRFRTADIVLVCLASLAFTVSCVELQSAATSHELSTLSLYALLAAGGASLLFNRQRPMFGCFFGAAILALLLRSASPATAWSSDSLPTNDEFSVAEYSTSNLDPQCEVALASLADINVDLIAVRGLTDSWSTKLSWVLAKAYPNQYLYVDHGNGGIGLFARHALSTVDSYVVDGTLVVQACVEDARIAGGMEILTVAAAGGTAFETTAAVTLGDLSEVSNSGHQFAMNPRNTEAANSAARVDFAALGSSASLKSGVYATTGLRTLERRTLRRGSAYLGQRATFRSAAANLVSF